MITSQRFYSNATIKASYKTIGVRLVENEREVRAIAESRGYKNFNVDLLSFTKIGFRKYFVIWQVTGRFVEI